MVRRCGVKRVLFTIPAQRQPGPDNLSVFDRKVPAIQSDAAVEAHSVAVPRLRTSSGRFTDNLDAGLWQERRLHLDAVFISTNVVIIGISPGEHTANRIPRPSAYGFASENIVLILHGSELAMAMP